MLHTWGTNDDAQCTSIVENDGIISIPRLCTLNVDIPISRVSMGSRHSLFLTNLGAVYSVGWGQV